VQQTCIRELEQKLIASDAAIEHHIDQIDRLTKYMGHMPSMEEHQALETQNREIQIQCDIMAKRLAEAEIALKKALRGASEKDFLVQSKECIQRELEDTRLGLETHKQRIAILEPENMKLKKECQHLKKVVVEAERRCRQELQAMRERHRARFVEATAKLRNQYKSLAKRARALESQLTKNSDAMMALNSELQNSQGTIGALKTSVKDLVFQNQELLEKNISLQESTSEALKVSSCLSEAQSSAVQQLRFELSHCTEELDSLVSLSLSLLKGKEPNPTMLFGSDSRAMPSDEDLSEDFESRLAQVKCLRHKIEDLRSMISEHFATQLSSVCHVQ
jgi:chromosome segregation ATPase